MKRNFLKLFSLLLTGFVGCLSVGAQETSLETVSQPEVVNGFQGLPIKPQQETSKRKIRQSQLLGAWVKQQLEAKQVKVAIIARIGSPFAVLFDKTGMTHSGYVFRHPETGQWTTYSLYADTDAGYKKSRLWQQSVESFYYGQSGRKTDALVFVPSMALQEKLLARLTAQPFKTLLPENEHYSLVAPMENPLSFNCTKWVLLQLLAEQNCTDDTETLIQHMTRDFNTPVVKPSFLVRYILKKKPDVNWQELSPPDHIQTVTVNSFYQSSLFEKKWYYHENPSGGKTREVKQEAVK